MKICTILLGKSELSDDLEFLEILLLRSRRADVDFSFSAQSFSETSKDQTVSIIEKKSSGAGIDETVL